MAGALTIGKGADPGYYTAQASRGTDYYAAGAGLEQGGSEPEGVWSGDGCGDLGLTRGGVVDHEAFGFIFGSHIDPRDGSKIGRALKSKDEESIYGEMLRREPGATAERRSELFALAQAQAARGRSVQFFDATFSVSKSITLLHASARAQKLAAQERGDIEGEAQAQLLEDTIWSAISKGAAAGMDHLQAHAGYTRTGQGGVRQEDAHGWTVALWRQHTSRRGDPQLHIHQTILNKVKTARDGRVRTIDGQGIYRERGAAAAISTVVMENELTRTLGVEWVQRPDGHGREIKGVHQGLMDEFSSRARQDIGPELARVVAEYREQYGHDPDELALWKMGQSVARSTREAKQDADQAELVREWSRRAAEQAGQALEPLAAQVTGAAQPAAQLSEAQERVIMARALNSLQAKRSTWTRSDLTKAIGEQLPADLGVMSEDQAARLLPDLTDRCLQGEAGRVQALAAPELLDVPDSMRRADGESVYVQHDATRYATDAQLDLERKIIDLAAQDGAPCADPARVAELLGADLAALEAQLAPDAPADVTTVTGSGLLLSQAAAAHAIMTRGKRGQVLIGPAGTGKSTVLAKIAELWPQLHPGARVVALTETQQGANVLRGMGIADSHNVSMFLTDPRLQGLRPGDLMLLDEASMVTMGHASTLLGMSADAGALAVLAGDDHQHQAVEAGGALRLVSDDQGSLQLAEALRFADPWERQASLRLRTGDVSVLPEYDQRGRVVGGHYEQMAEECYRRWLADYLAGTDSVMIASTNEDALELSRRARADLVRFGRVDGGPGVKLREDAEASPGDLIMARKNEHGQAIANRQVYEVREVCPDGSASVVFTETGEVKTFPADYLAAQCHLAYGCTSHSVQGATVQGTGYALVRKTDDAEYVYTAMSRGRLGNVAFAVTSEPVPATGKPAGAAEVARSRELEAEQAGRLQAGGPVESGLGVLTEALERTGAELSATSTLAHELSDADSLAVLSRRWADLAGGEYARRYDVALRQLLPEDQAEAVITDHGYRWLCRTLRAGEMIGMSGDQVLADAIAAGSLADADSVCAVIDHRAREIIPATLPLDGGWAARSPRMPDPGTDRLLTETGQAMDERIGRLGDHVAATRPLWAERSLGPVPDDETARAGWTQRAAAIAAYREMTGYRNPADPIGPAPAASSPELRGAWHTALAAVAKVDGVDLTGLSARELESRRALYGQETARAPLHPGRELRLSRLARDHAAVRADRSTREAEAAADTETRALHEGNAATWTALRDRASEAAELYAEAMSTREDWQRISEPTTRLATAADLEVRRRDPWARHEPLRNLEPVSDLAPAEASDQEVLAALGLTPDATELDAHPQRTADAARVRQLELDELASMPAPDEDHELEPSESWGVQAQRQREAVSQPPDQLVPPSERLLEREAAG